MSGTLVDKPHEGGVPLRRRNGKEVVKLVMKLVSYVGFSLFILGVACVDSPSLVVPLAMIASGLEMVAVSAWAERGQKGSAGKLGE